MRCDAAGRDVVQSSQQEKVVIKKPGISSLDESGQKSWVFFWTRGDRRCWSVLQCHLKEDSCVGVFVVRTLLMGVFTICRVELVAVLVFVLVIPVMAVPMLMHMLMGVNMDMGVLMGVGSPVGMGVLVDMAVNMLMIVFMGLALVVFMGVDMDLWFIGCHASAGFTHSFLLSLHCFTRQKMLCRLQNFFWHINSYCKVRTRGTRVNSAKTKTLCHCR